MSGHSRPSSSSLSKPAPFGCGFYFDPHSHRPAREISCPNLNAANVTRPLHKGALDEFMRLACLIFCVLIAFAGNSVLARMALGGSYIGPWGFSLIRFASGAIVLLLLARPKQSWPAGSWPAAIALSAYGVFFSLAYRQLATGTGALILFASVQLTMLAAAFSKGEKLSAKQIVGVMTAMGGLFYLLAPNVEAPSLKGASLMALSELGWGIYSILGASAGPAIARTTGNFARSAILFVFLSPAILVFLPETPPETKGLILAVLSGTLTSGLGYALWYVVLPQIRVTTAAISQLSVPVIAAVGGAVFVFEPVSWSFVVACILVLTGVGIATIRPYPSSVSPHPRRRHVVQRRSRDRQT